MFDKKINLNELIKRTIITIIFAPLILFIMSRGGMYVVALMLCVSFLIGCEWQKLIEYEKNKLWYLVGVLYVILPTFSVIYLGFFCHSSLLVSLTMVVWATDIGGYIVGKSIGGPKIWPSISPNKTLAGFVGGLVLASITGYYLGEPISAIVLIAMVAQFGDLLESVIKRRFGADKSGDIIPGHGGVMDRFDSFALVSVFVAAVEWLSGL